MSYPKQFLDEIRLRVSLSEVIGKRVRVQRAGREFKACCPFHKEKTASFTINDQKGFYHCFGCGAHGDVISFLTEHDRLSFPDAVKSLAAQAGLEVPEETAQQKEIYAKQDRSYDLLEATAKWFEQQLWHSSNSQALSYMLERGLSDNTLKQFRVGYAPKSYDSMIEELESQGYSLAEMEKVGLARTSTKKDGKPYTFFRNRIVFPVMDTKGRVVAFGGRILPFAYGGPNPDMERTPPKYLNSPDHDLFHKGRMLYGLISNVRKALSDGQKLVIVEGYMDVIALAQAGHFAAVAPLGTALTETQVTEAWRLMFNEGLKAPILCFDGDNAGRRAALRAMDRSLPLLKPDHSVHLAFLPEGHDPDTLVKERGYKAFLDLINKPVSLFAMLWEEENKLRSMDTPEALAGFKTALINKAKLIADKTVQDIFLKQIEKRFREVFYSAGQKSFPQRKKSINKNAYKTRMEAEKDAHRPQFNPIRQRPNAMQIRERILLAILLNYPELFDEFGEIFGMMPAKTAGFDALRHDMVNMLAENPDISSAELQSQLKQNNHAESMQFILTDEIYMHASFAKPGQYIDDVREGWQDTLSHTHN